MPHSPKNNRFDLQHPHSSRGTHGHSANYEKYGGDEKYEYYRVPKNQKEESKEEESKEEVPAENNQSDEEVDPPNRPLGFKF